MNAMREAWTDERLDDLTKRVDEGFRESRQDLRQFRVEIKVEMDARFDRVDARFDRVDKKFEILEQRFERRFD